MISLNIFLKQFYLLPNDCFVALLVALKQLMLVGKIEFDTQQRTA